jgi:16S rRNA pseudouridine516 synthase
MDMTQLLFSQGFGTRRACQALILNGDVQVDGRRVSDPMSTVSLDGLVFYVHGVAWPYRHQALVMLHKPAGFECSLKPRHHPSVLSLLPSPLRLRGLRGVQPVGRLDVDTTGLLLLTDDGTLLHRLTSPKHHVPKVYQVTTKHPVSDTQVTQLLRGVLLDDDPKPVAALHCALQAPTHLAMTLAQGKYHQVKRMLAAVGNRVEALHRSSLGPVALPADLAEGAWCWLDGSVFDATYTRAQHPHRKATKQPPTV